MKKIHFRWVIIILIIFLTYIFSPGYIKVAIVHFLPGIEDYDIFESREVKVAKPTPWHMAKDYMQDDLTPNERDTLEHYQSVAYLIIQNDSLIYEEYWDGYSQHSLSNSFSAAKSVVGLLIGAAIQDGFIKSINQAVADFIPEYKNYPNNTLTIKDLLTMSSGLNWEESYRNPFSLTTQAYYGDNINQLVLDLTVIEKPGEKFKYLSGNTQLLAILIKNATGKTLSDYASEKLWQPLGAENTALWSLDKKEGDEKAYCCLNSNARDFARIGKVILDKGRINGIQIIPEQYIEEATEAADYLKHARSNEPVDFYGYQWWIVRHNDQLIPYARGILGQYIFVLREQNAIVVRLGHKRSRNKINHHPSEIYTYLTAARRILQSRIR